MRKIDAYTFGDSPAAVTLAKLLGQDEYSGCSKRVSKKFSDFARVLKFIDQIEDNEMRRILLNLWVKEGKINIEKAKIDDKIKSYLLNIENTLYKKLRRSNDNV